jgi:hypothetical protein
VTGEAFSPPYVGMVFDTGAGDATASDRVLAARIAAHTSWAVTPNREVRTRPARAAFLLRFERQVDPDGVLAPAERQRRAESARRAYFRASR